MLRLMCITAHPDDEASNFGGTLRLYADRGVETSVVCLTPGQAGSHRGGAKSDQELATLRREEFAAACQLLKVKEAVVLDYLKSGKIDPKGYAAVRNECKNRIDALARKLKELL